MAITSPNLRLVADASKQPKKVESVLDLIGETPLLEIRRVSEGLHSKVKIYAKLEGFNPGGSVKDRAAWRMVVPSGTSVAIPSMVIFNMIYLSIIFFATKALRH